MTPASCNRISDYNPNTIISSSAPTATPAATAVATAVATVAAIATAAAASTASAATKKPAKPKRKGESQSKPPPPPLPTDHTSVVARFDALTEETIKELKQPKGRTPILDGRAGGVHRAARHLLHAAPQ